MPKQGMEKQISLKQAGIIILVVVIATVLIGILIGNMFFWHPISMTKEDVELKSVQNLIDKQPKSISGYLAMGGYYLRKEQPEEALKWIEKAEKLNKTHKLVQFNKGLAYLQMKKYDDAIKLMRPLATDSVFNYDAEYYTGAAYYMKGDYDNAIDRFKMAIVYNSAAADARVFLAKAYYKKGDKKAALDYLNNAMAMVPDYQEAMDVKKVIEANGQLKD